MKEQIIDYYMEWHQSANKGSIIVRTPTRRHEFKFIDGNEFAAISTILKESPVFTDGQLIFTGWESPAEGASALPINA